MRDVHLYLDDILKSIVYIESFVAGQSLEQFSGDEKTSSAVVQKLLVIGEAAKHLRILWSPSIQKSPGKRWQGCGTA